jgi:hypothetical protein
MGDGAVALVGEHRERGGELRFDAGADLNEPPPVFFHVNGFRHLLSYFG